MPPRYYPRYSRYPRYARKVYTRRAKGYATSGGALRNQGNLASLPWTRTFLNVKNIPLNLAAGPNELTGFCIPWNLELFPGATQMSGIFSKFRINYIEYDIRPNWNSLGLTFTMEEDSSNPNPSFSMGSQAVADVIDSGRFGIGGQIPSPNVDSSTTGAFYWGGTDEQFEPLLQCQNARCGRQGTPLRGRIYPRPYATITNSGGAGTAVNGQAVLPNCWIPMSEAGVRLSPITYYTARTNFVYPLPTGLTGTSAQAIVTMKASVSFAETY